MGGGSASKDALIGTEVDGRYLVQSELGVGGMGRVYRAEQTNIGRSVAIKVLSGEFSNNHEAVERFKNEDPVPVYRRLRNRGRLAPEGLKYISSWVNERLESCFQLMETADPKLIDEWISNWNDIIEFKVYPVISSTDAQERVSSRL